MDTTSPYSPIRRAAKLPCLVGACWSNVGVTPLRGKAFQIRRSRVLHARGVGGSPDMAQLGRVGIVATIAALALAGCASTVSLPSAVATTSPTPAAAAPTPS